MNQISQPPRIADQSAEPMQFVSDIRKVTEPNSGIRRLVDPEAAADLMARETTYRLEAIFDQHPGTPILLLSGGVDSIFIAATAARIGVSPLAVTVTTEGGTDETNAALAARALALTHDIIRLDPIDVVALARRAITRLGVSELWEVTAAIPILAAAPTWQERPGLGPILTGNGADVILAGGHVLSHPIHSRAALDEADQIIRTKVGTSFTYHRLVPHFYSALMGGDSARLVHVFQTTRFWDIAETFAPPVLFGEQGGTLADKFCLRIACERLLPEHIKHLAWAKKDAIQRSSGIMGSLARSAREQAANLPGARTYTDPAIEPFEAIATRLYLALLADHGN